MGMQEYVTDAVSLRKFSQGDLDGRYVLFTKRFGKIVGKAKSSRKITSKLAPHLEPGTIAKVRFIESPGTQIIDALKEGTATASLLDLHFLSMLLPEGQPEPDLWDMLQEGSFAWTDALAALGWDPEGARCVSCGVRPGVHFYLPRQEFFCDVCIGKLPSKVRQSAVLSLHVPV
jgi:recombinational DNA repair protein (RecF pathway)